MGEVLAITKQQKPPARGGHVPTHTPIKVAATLILDDLDALGSRLLTLEVQVELAQNILRKRDAYNDDEIREGIRRIFDLPA